MSRYDCTPRQSTEPGDKVVEVVNYPKEVDASGFLMIELVFQIEGQDKTLQQRFFPNQLTGMFKAMGWAELSPNVFDGDIQQAHGMKFIAELWFEEYEKKDHTKGKARRLRNFRSLNQGEVQEEQYDPTPVDNWGEE